ncbi:hypothetical protein [Brachyspira murdochii]|uniref:hypothetical protein n=1 Tax=Brachyspira murdochii TaxID=84378 RepID=UPI0012F47DC0|nr:hypothetical protein [Brachyspira murdochii]
MLKNNIDIVSFDYYWVEDEMYYGISEHRYDNNFIYGKFIFKTYCTKEKIYGQLWDKMYKRKLLIELGDDLIPEHISGEDQVASFKIMYNADSFLYLPIVLYHHNRRKNSITNQCNDELIKDKYKILKYIYEYCEKNDIFDLYRNYVESFITDTIFISTAAMITIKLNKEPSLKDKYSDMLIELIIFSIKNNYISIEWFKKFIDTLYCSNIYYFQYLLEISNKAINIIENKLSN